MKKRSSNIELLRITAMIMIIAYHLFLHCIKAQLTDSQSISASGNDCFCHPYFSKRLCILALISPMGQAGNAIFLMISGYFMAHKDSMDLTKISKKLLLQLGFSAMLLGFSSISLYTNIKPFPPRLIPFSVFNSLAWFVGYYFIVMVAAKVFLNQFLNKLDRKNYLMFLLVLFSLLQFGWSAIILSNLCGGLDVIATGIFLYSLGGYIRKYNPFENIRLWAVLAVILLTDLIVIGNFYIHTASNILEYDAAGGGAFVQSIPEYANNHLFPLLLGIAVFELFRRIKLPRNGMINFIGASTFMVYLLHDNELVYKAWCRQNWITLLHENMISFLMIYMIWILITFSAGSLSYCIFLLGGSLLRLCKPLTLKGAEADAEKAPSEKDAKI